MLLQAGHVCIVEPVEDPERRLFVTARKGQQFKYRKKRYRIDNAIGAPYGAVFELQGRGVKMVAQAPVPADIDADELSASTGASADKSSSSMPSSLADLSTTSSNAAVAASADVPSSSLAQIAQLRANEELAAAAAAAAGVVVNDNRNLVDDNKSQKLGQRDVQAMKESGASAAQIVSSLVANSTTFHTKTEFAKAKYLRKKQRQYAPTFRLVPCCAQTIVDTMRQKDIRRCCGLRGDSMAQILAYGHVRAGSTILTVDAAMGMLVGAVAERMDGNGRVVNLCLGPHPNVSCVERFNLSDAGKASVQHFPFSLVPLLVASRSRVAAAARAGGVETAIDTGTGSSDGDGDGDGSGVDTGFEQWQQTRHLLSITQARAVLAAHGADSFVAVTSDQKYHAKDVLMAALPLLAPSACFAVFCPYIEPLQEAADHLKKTGTAVHIDLTQLWVRQFQVAPGRTRPDMNMDDGTGYILSGIKCMPATEEVAVPAPGAPAKVAAMASVAAEGANAETERPAKRAKTGVEETPVA